MVSSETPMVFLLVFADEEPTAASSPLRQAQMIARKTAIPAWICRLDGTNADRGRVRLWFPNQEVFAATLRFSMLSQSVPSRGKALH